MLQTEVLSTLPNNVRDLEEVSGFISEKCLFFFFFSLFFFFFLVERDRMLRFIINSDAQLRGQLAAKIHFPHHNVSSTKVWALILALVSPMSKTVLGAWKLFKSIC